MIWQPDEPRGRPPSNQGGSIPYLPRNSTTELIAQPLRQSKQFFRVVVADGIPDKRIDLVPSPEDSIQLCPARIRQFQNIPTTGVRVGFSRDVAGSKKAVSHGAHAGRVDVERSGQFDLANRLHMVNRRQHAGLTPGECPAAPVGVALPLPPAWLNGEFREARDLLLAS